MGAEFLIFNFKKCLRNLLSLIFICAAGGCEWGMMHAEQQDGFEDGHGPDLSEDIFIDTDAQDADIDVPEEVPGPDGVDVTDIVDVDVEGEMDIVDVETEEPLPECTTEGEYRCTPDGAERCQGGSWVSIGQCPLGCDETAEGCYVPTNIPAGSIDDAAGDLDLSSSSRSLIINTDTGEIRAEDGTIIRPAVLGHDPTTGTTFQVVDQAGGAPPIGVFSVGAFTLPSGATLRAEGSNALAIAASGSIIIDGVINMCASGAQPGPGGWAGGGPEQGGQGMCPGSPGIGGDSSCMDGIYNPYCSVGGGGGGFGGAGGKGGDGNGPVTYTGGAGGGPCGTPELSPLIGGSGGGGGGIVPGVGGTAGTGGGGGGAIQLVSSVSISFGDSGGIHSGGDGGSESDRGGGAGGGAGGGILVESPDIDVVSGVIRAANGGGGGGGDCN